MEGASGLAQAGLTRKALEAAQQGGPPSLVPVPAAARDIVIPKGGLHLASVSMP